MENRIAELESTIDELRVELELLNATFELAEAGFTVSDEKGIVLKINPAQVRITGHSPDKTLGRSMEDIETENQNQSATMQVVNTGEAVALEQILPSGKSYLVYGKPYFSDSDALKYVVCTLVDTTEYNYTLQELEASKHNNYDLTKRVESLQRLLETQKKIVCSSSRMQKVVELCEKIAPFNSTILICGESGVGKELIADFIWQRSTRPHMPFVKINCAAIPETLLESELFGYEAGAFTGAHTKGKKGIFETADGGTILLDEIEAFPFHLQPKILRVLQEGEFYRVGGTESISTNVRLIAATNSDLEKMIEAGTFRKDLYYRLSVISLSVPSLRERPEDIPPLIRSFILHLNQKYDMKKEITSEAVNYLKGLTYEGNVRELQNIIERITLLSQNTIIGLKDVLAIMHAEEDAPFHNGGEDDKGSPDTLKSIVGAFEKELLQSYWNEYQSATKIAETLHTNQPTISRKLHAYGIGRRKE